MMRDLLTRGGGPVKRQSKKERRDDDVDMVVLPEGEEPTWEVRRPGGTVRRMNRRTRAILTVAAVTAVVVNAGAAWAYWSITGSDTAGDRAGAAVELALRGRSDLAQPLTPGGVGDLTVTLTNDRNYPIRVDSIARGLGAVVADDEHREAGCKDVVVGLTREAFDVSWKVGNNTVGAFTIKDGLTMRAGAPAACQGATFTVPLTASGVRQRQ